MLSGVEFRIDNFDKRNLRQLNDLYAELRRLEGSYSHLHSTRTHTHTHTHAHTSKHRHTTEFLPDLMCVCVCVCVHACLQVHVIV